MIFYHSNIKFEKEKVYTMSLTLSIPCLRFIYPLKRGKQNSSEFINEFLKTHPCPCRGENRVVLLKCKPARKQVRRYVTDSKTKTSSLERGVLINDFLKTHTYRSFSTLCSGENQAAIRKCRPARKHVRRCVTISETKTSPLERG